MSVKTQHGCMPCVRVHEKLLIDNAGCVIRLTIQLPITGKVVLVLSGGGRSWLDKRHLVPRPYVWGDS